MWFVVFSLAIADGRARGNDEQLGQRVVGWSEDSLSRFT